MPGSGRRAGAACWPGRRPADGRPSSAGRARRAGPAPSFAPRQRKAGAKPLASARNWASADASWARPCADRGFPRIRRHLRRGTQDAMQGGFNDPARRRGRHISLGPMRRRLPALGRTLDAWPRTPAASPPNTDVAFSGHDGDPLEESRRRQATTSGDEVNPIPAANKIEGPARLPARSVVALCGWRVERSRRSRKRNASNPTRSDIR